MLEHWLQVRIGELVWWMVVTTKLSVVVLLGSVVSFIYAGIQAFRER